MGSERSTCPAHRAALATVTRISFTLAGVGALGGCIESPQAIGDPWSADDAERASDALPAPDMADADPFDAGWADQDFAADAGSDVMVAAEGDTLAPDPEPDAAPDATPDATPDAVVWSETMPCPPAHKDPDAWAACCEAQGWGSSPNCAAWGPPMPPRMPA